MKDVVFFLAIMAALIGTWLFVARKLKAKGKGGFIRHVAAALSGVAAFFVTAMLLVGFVQESPDDTSAAESEVAASTQGDETAASDESTDGIPTQDLSELYSIASDETRAPHKRTVEVILHQRLNEDRLEEVGKAIKELGEQEVERTFIGYRLDSQDPETAYWGTTHYNPELSVDILGFSASEYQEALNQDVSSDYENIIGSWIIERGYPHLSVAYVDNGKVFIDGFFDDGSVGTTEYLAYEDEDDAVRLKKENEHPDEYLTIDEDGNLRFWSDNGNYFTAPLRNEGNQDLSLDGVELLSLQEGDTGLSDESSTSNSNEITFTGKGHAACVSESLLDQLITAASNDDQRGMNYLLGNGCVVPRAGIPVSVLDRTWTGKVHVRAYAESGDAMEMWTVAEALSDWDS
ncbi:hypothetical protein SAMN05216571_10815 [Onishia taeanensis]|uniref:Uncharacterized protein n=1 Tax=Onishia taeanensis TaxID=284577 RepID=A0A1G7SYH4_9GAMM|nr:hypothetical protein [Halomonas taeanensis]SDG27370.1 hypothetical protein SAMN05216571_10815 [Halomonas taeanensis]